MHSGAEPPAFAPVQSPHGSLAKGLAGLAVSGGRSEFPVVPLEATLVKALLGWAAGAAQSVEVKGSYDGWGPARRLQKQPDGSWSIAAYLSPGVYQVGLRVFSIASWLRPRSLTSYTHQLVHRF